MENWLLLGVLIGRIKEYIKLGFGESNSKGGRAISISESQIKKFNGREQNGNIFIRIFRQE